MRKAISLFFVLGIFLSACGTVSTQPASPAQTGTPAITPTATHTPTATITPLPTLLIDDQESYVKEFLEGNTDCRLPCWWGITPGKTSWQDSETLLRHLGATIKQFQSETGGYNYGVLLRGLPELVFSFYDNGAPNSIVDKIFVSGNKGGGQDQREFEIFWESYSPKEVMTKYGIPSRILLDTLGTLGNTDMGKHGYTVWIFYDSLGFMIRYDGFIADEDTFRFCFNLNQGANDIDHIELTLQHQGYAFPLESGDSILSTYPTRGIPIQNVANISVEEFHQLFTQVEQPYCLETPHDIWPTR
ncbi:MAG: hypothetical protein J0M11_16210 [Anaerolineae bacterium]|nr:hypothetical protein [Anaerolineae bacterium]